MNSWKCHPVFSMGHGRRSWAWQGNFVQALLIQYLQLLCVCTVTMDCTTKDLKEESYLQCWRDRSSDYGKKDIILNFILVTPTLSVTKATVHFCTCAKRCRVLWLPTKSFFTDTGAVEGDVCDRVHVHTHKNKKHRISISRVLVLLFLVVVTQPCKWLCTINCSGFHLKFVFQMVGERAVALSSVGQNRSCTSSPCRATAAHAAIQLKRQERKTDQVFYSKLLKS